MKGLKLLFAVLLVPLAFQAAFANDEIDTSRAATTRRDATNTVSANRQKSNPLDQKTAVQSSLPVSRTVNIGASEKSTQSRERSTTKQISNRTAGNVVNRAGTTAAQNKSVSARTANNTQQRAQQKSAASRIMTRTATPQQASKSRSGIVSRAATSNRAGTTTTSRSRSATTARSASTPIATIDTIQSRNFSACRDVFYECMDEFCANKDSTLKRCACSARVHDFDKTKEQLSAVEDKLLDFSQRLLTVSMDKEDALVLNTATEGEIAYAVDDTSKSKKMLDDIAKKLNASFDNNNFDQNLNAISLSLNTDAAFDNIDSMMGASTTTKSGTELYRAALPVCREMAAEICSGDDLDIAESSYQMAIAQDCNTVAKSYETQNEQARAKIKESSALLDMSRLNVHQERNSDDILTCKSKMLEMLTDTTVCGTDMSKCLDYTGQYIDPTTGQAFLTTNLAELGNLLQRPDADSTWTKTTANKEFVLFLQSKKVYLEPAMESCQDISTFVWDAFIEDALAQIKLAQDAKLEQARQSCTTLTTQCLDTANKTITDFDARALSIFGVKADVTVNAMCADIRNTCVALTNAIGSTTDSEGNEVNEWEQGITEITADKTYATILSTCREVGKNCIIQACTDISGNFGLCTNIDTSINRKSIVSRRACWAEVEQCIRDAGEDAITQIMTQQGRTGETDDDKYTKLYFDLGITAPATEAKCINKQPSSATTYRNIYKWTEPETNDFDKYVHRLTEQIWGNCEMSPGTDLTNDLCTNRIIINQDAGDNETLLSWFARNTNTTDAIDSCRDTLCGFGMENYGGECVPAGEFTNPDMLYCPSNTNEYTQISDGNNTNCCSTEYDVNAVAIKNSKNQTICCVDGATEGPQPYANYASATEVAISLNSICRPTEKIDNTNVTLDRATLAFSTSDADYYCVHEYTESPITPSGTTLTCDGVWTVVRRDTQTYTTPTAGDDDIPVQNFFYGVTDAVDNISTGGAMIGTPNDTHKKPDTTPE